MNQKYDSLDQMASGADLRGNALGRINAGKALLAGGDFDFALEMFCFALECALKACICKTLGLSEYPDKHGNERVNNFFKTHDFDRLLLLSGFQKEFELRPGNVRKYRNWSDATTAWDIDKRYSPLGLKSREDAERVLSALTKPDTGVITWIEGNRKW